MRDEVADRFAEKERRIRANKRHEAIIIISIMAFLVIFFALAILGIIPGQWHCIC